MSKIASRNLHSSADLTQKSLRVFSSEKQIQTPEQQAFWEKGFDSVQFSFPEGKNYGFVICESEAQASLILRTPITMGWTVLRMKRSRREEPAQPDDEVPYWTMMDGYYGEWWP